METGDVAAAIVCGSFFLGGLYKAVKELRNNNRDSKIVLCEEGSWMELGIKYLRDPDNDEPKYIRMGEKVTKANLEASWCWFGYAYFEPDGDIRENTIGHAIERYTLVPKALADRLEKAYHKKRGSYVKAKQNMHNKALKSFLA